MTESPTPEELAEEFKSLLAEGFHTAFRKASDHESSGQIWRLISDLPPDHWRDIIEFATEPTITALEGKQQDLNHARAACLRASGAAYDERLRAESAEAKLAELEPRIADVVGALNKIAGYTPDSQIQPALIARAALSGANTEKWRELLERLSLLNFAMQSGMTSWEDSDTRKLIVDVIDAFAALHSSTGERP